MLKKTIQHNDFDGNPTETTVYFNLTKAEAIELNIRTDLEIVGQSKDNNQIMDAWRRILQMAYGKRLANGDFVKEGFAAFAAGEAYSELFMTIWQDSDYASEFIKGILPAGIIAAEEGQQETRSNIPEHMRNHPSMQSNLAPRQAETPRHATPPVESAIVANTVDPSNAIVEDKGYQDYLAYRASQGVQVPKQFGDIPDELI